MQLVYDAATVHRQNHDPSKIQVSTLISIKTGGCPEDCGYCPQAARYHTQIEKNDLLPYETVINLAKRAKDMAWQSVQNITVLESVMYCLSFLMQISNP